MLLVNVTSLWLLSVGALAQPAAPRTVPAALRRSAPPALDSAATVRVARRALARVFRRIEVPAARYRVVGLTRDSLGSVVRFTSCPAVEFRTSACVDGGASVRVRPDGRAQVLTIR